MDDITPKRKVKKPADAAHVITSAVPSPAAAHSQKPHSLRTKNFILATLLLVAVLAGIGYAWRSHNGFKIAAATPAAITPPTPPAPAVPLLKTVSAHTLSMGDVFWGRYVDAVAKKSPLGVAYPFSHLNTFNRANYDAWIADLECPVTDKYIPPAVQESNLSFSCPKEYTPEAAKWFTAFTIANNHTSNRQDVDGFNQTKATLEANKIQYFGHYDLHQKDDLCEVIGLPVSVTLTDGTTEKNTMPIALCGYHVLAGFPTDDQLAEITAYSKYLPTWVYPHGGVEYTPAPPQVYIDLYHRMIDAGADMVLGDHPHWVQTSEAYKGKLIVYSMGNFIFDQLGLPEQGGWELHRGVAVDVTISTPYSPVLKKLLEVGDSCKAFKDTCLATLQAASVKKPTFSYAYDVIASDNSDHNSVVTKASADWQQKTLDRLQWATTLKGLSPEL